MTEKTPPFDRVLADCVESVLTGEASIEACLDRYPQYRQKLSGLLPLAKSLHRAPKVNPSPNFRLRCRDRLLSRLADRSSPPVTLWERIRTPLISRYQTLTFPRPAISWVLIIGLVVALLGGGVGVAYAADGSSPGQALYGFDQATESAQMALTFDAESRAELSLAFAEERVSEAQSLAAAGASEEAIVQAAAGYRAEIQKAAQALAEVASSGDQARAQALSELLDSSLSVHESVLSEVAAQVPQQAAAAVQEAIESSREGMPGDPPEGAGRPDVPGRPDGAPGGFSPGGEDGEAAAPASFEDRIAGLDEHIMAAQAHAEGGDHETARVELEQYQTEVNALAQELAAMGTDTAGRAEALAALLDEALNRHSEVLTELADGVPAQARIHILNALDSSAAGRATLERLFGDGRPGGPPEGVPGAGRGNGPN